MVIFSHLVNSLKKLFKRGKNTHKKKSKLKRKVSSKIKSVRQKRSKHKRSLRKKSKKSPPKTKIRKAKSKGKSSKRSTPKNIHNDRALQQGVLVGEITHYFSRIQVVVLKMTKGTLKLGDKIHIHGRLTDFIQKVDSLQIESVNVQTVRQGQLVGLKVIQKTKEGDRAFKL